jgi:GTP cyclohydrolase II
MNASLPDIAALLQTAGGRGPDPARAAAIRVDRACTELRRGRPVALGEATDTEAGTWLLAAAVETLSDTLLQRLQATGAPLRLVLSAERLHALGRTDAQAPELLPLPATLTLQQLQQLAAVLPGGPGAQAFLPAGHGAPAGAPARAALALAKRARLLPALLTLALPAAQGAALAAAQVLQLDAADVARAAPMRADTLRRVSDARVPIGASEDCTLTVFREVDGDAEHLAIAIGQHAPGAAVPVRLHSACLTGDLLDSLRCDCGPQLQRAVARLGETGGVLLYLAQEGRGTGLVNKLRAYRLQDGGLDTLQADRHLGFRDDERNFAAAAAMLHALGHTRIQLLTNNPHKIDALREAGIEVVGRLPLHGPVNDHNQRYLQTKQQAGHLVGDD